MWRLAAAFVLFGLLSGAWYLWNVNTEAQPELVQQPNTLQKENTVPVQPEVQKKNLVADTEKNLNQKHNQIKRQPRPIIQKLKKKYNQKK